MNTELSIFNQTLKRKGIPIYVNDRTTSINGYLKEIDDKQSIDTKWLFCPKDTFNQGDIIEALNEKWMILQKDIKYKNYDKGLIQCCYKSVKFVINGFLMEFSCLIISNNQSISSNQYFNIPDGTIKVILQENEFTKQIAIDDRFIKMSSAWKVTGITSEDEGLLYITASKDAIDTINDDMTNEIADTNKLHKYVITINNGDTSSVNVNGTLQLNCVCTDNGTAVTSPAITYISSDSTIATIDGTGKITGIAAGVSTITANYNNVIDTISITVTNVVTDNYTINLTPIGTNNIITIIYNHNKTFDAKVQNNGVDTSDTVTFELFNVDTSYTFDKLGSITSSTENSCVVQTVNNTSMIGKKFGLRCKIVGHESVFVERIIKVGSY